MLCINTRPRSHCRWWRSIREATRHCRWHWQTGPRPCCPRRPVLLLLLLPWLSSFLLWLLLCRGRQLGLLVLREG
jgi:hypothetical protein